MVRHVTQVHMIGGALARRARHRRHAASREGDSEDDVATARTTTTATSTTHSRSSRGGDDDDVVESLSELKLRVHALKEEVEHYRVLGERASDACEDHRRELTLLQQKERAIRAANEDKLRSALEHVLQDNTTLQARLAEQRQRHAEVMRAELREAREQGSRKAAELQGELDKLQEECSEAKAALQNAEQEKRASEAQLREDVSAQVELKAAVERLRGRVSAAAAADPSALHRADSGTPPSSSRHAAKGDLDVTDPYDEGDSRAANDTTSAHLVTSAVRRVTPAHERGGLFLPAGPTDPSRPRSPLSHHIVSLVSTVKRRNLVRPRAYYQRHGYDVDYGGSPFRRLLATAAAPQGGSSWPLTDLQDNVCGDHAAGCLATQKRASEPTAPLPTCNEKYSGHAINAACKALLQELAVLRVEYMHYYRQLRDPHAASLEASQGLRTTMVAIDRKVAQVHALRRQQARYSAELRVRDILHEVVRENKYCDALYKDLLALLRAPSHDTYRA